MKAIPRRYARTPTVLQLEAVECGAACLAMMLAYFGRSVPLEELRQRCGVSRDGSTAGNLVRAAALYGLAVKGYKYDLSALRAVAPPFVIFWEFRHFVVVEGYDEKAVALNDPAVGRRRVTWAEFDRAFTGVTLTFAKTDRFERNAVAPPGLAILATRLRESIDGVGYIVLAGIALVVPGIVIPALTQVFVDDVLIGRHTLWGRDVVISIALAIALSALLVHLQQSVTLRLQTKLAVTSAARFFWHVLNMPTEFYAQRSAGELSYRVHLNDRVADLLSGRITAAAVRAISAIFFLVLMLRYDIVLSLLSVTIALINILALRAANRTRGDANAALLQAEGELLTTAVTGIRWIETLKAAGAEHAFMQRWGSRSARVTNARQALGLPTQLLVATPRLLAALNTAAILGFGSLRVIDGALSLGTLFAFFLLSEQFSAPFAEIVRFGSEFQEMDGNLRRIEDVYRYPADVPPLLVARAESQSFEGALELRDVRFGYSPVAPPLIAGLTLSFGPGQRIAIVGSTGSGKSTIAKLVSGLYAPTSGEILYDGRPREAYDPRAFAAAVATVDQEIALFAGTIRSNITLFDPTIDDIALERAARDACIHDDIMARAGGYDAPVEEAGRNFSGGQRQRLEIARALVRDPALIILDEATSALDPITEETIANNLKRRACACVIVAHRLSTIRDCDEIIVLECGAIIERGTHDELLARAGRYRELVSAV
jgi:NHLM bacteriocin system ABC transporter peptidase/ATP-binding protein